MVTVPSLVRLPRVLAGYRCGRSLVCCSAPWQAFLADDDVEVISASLRDTPELARRFTGALGETIGGRPVLAQREGACVLLDPPRDCVLHKACGLHAQPILCRSFPRSVAETPFGVEVAFILACPTAARRVVAAPEPFAWVERPLNGWPWPAMVDAIEDAPEWTEGGPMPFAELAGLRAAWWHQLDEVAHGDGDDVLQALLRMVHRPEAPGAAGTLDTAALAHQLEPELSQHLARYLQRLPDATWASALEPLEDALAAEITVPALRTSAAAAPAVWACALGLVVQMAGVHTTLTVRDGLHGAAWEIGLALLVHHAIRAATEAPPAEALVAALCAASQAGCATIGR